MDNGPTLGIFGCGVIKEVGSVRSVGRSKRVKVKLAGFPMDSFSKDRKLGLMDVELRVTDEDNLPKKGQAIWIPGGTYDIGLSDEGTKYHNVYAYTWWTMHPQLLNEPAATLTYSPAPAGGNIDLAAIEAAKKAAEAAAAGDQTAAQPTSESPASAGAVPDDDDPEIPW